MKKLLVIFFAACFVFSSSFAFAAKTTPEQWSKIKTRIISAPKDKVYTAILLYFLEQGFNLKMTDKGSGIIQTEWMKSKSATRFFVKAKVRYSIIIIEKDADSSRVTLNIIEDPDIVAPKRYDKFFTEIGEKLGVEMPPVAPTLKGEEKE